MTRRERIELVALASLVGGVAWLSAAWGMIVLGTIVLAASVAGRALQCFRR